MNVSKCTPNDPSTLASASLVTKGVVTLVPQFYYLYQIIDTTFIFLSKTFLFNLCYSVFLLWKLHLIHQRTGYQSINRSSSPPSISRILVREIALFHNGVICCIICWSPGKLWESCRVFGFYFVLFFTCYWKLSVVRTL